LPRKNRPYFDPLIVHIDRPDRIDSLARNIPDTARELMKRFWPGPLTLVLEKTGIVPDILTAGLATVAVRMPAHPVALRLIALADTPIAAPSANPFGYLSPTTARHVQDQLGERVPLILDGGPCTVGVESTIIRIENDRIDLLRAGGIPIEEIADITGLRYEDARSGLPEAPGQLPYHYAPETPIHIVTGLEGIDGAHAGLLTLSPVAETVRFAKTEVLSQSGDLSEAASRFFQALHALDAAGLERIYAIEMPEQGLGRAMMDRFAKPRRRENEKNP
jgi:L-threonylcarbamoyladenylate synthase